MKSNGFWTQTMKFESLSSLISKKVIFSNFYIDRNLNLNLNDTSQTASGNLGFFFLQKAI